MAFGYPFPKGYGWGNEERHPLCPPSLATTTYRFVIARSATRQSMQRLSFSKRRRRLQDCNWTATCPAALSMTHAFLSLTGKAAMSPYPNSLPIPPQRGGCNMRPSPLVERGGGEDGGEGDEEMCAASRLPSSLPCEGESAPAGAREGGQKNNTCPSKSGTISHFPHFFRLRASLPVAKCGNAASMTCVSWPRADANHALSCCRASQCSATHTGRMRKRQGKEPKAHPPSHQLARSKI
jgi:hypothetical protein